MQNQKATQTHPILDLLEHTKPEQDWVLVPLSGAVSREGSYGQFIKLAFRSDADEELTATCDRQHFDLLFPYIERLTAAESDRGRNGTKEEVLVPVFFLDKSKKWKFSHVGAQLLLSESGGSISKTGHMEISEKVEKYEFRCKSDTTAKASMVKIAKSNGMSLNEFLSHIIEREIQNNIPIAVIT